MEPFTCLRDPGICHVPYSTNVSDGSRGAQDLVRTDKASRVTRDGAATGKATGLAIEYHVPATGAPVSSRRLSPRTRSRISQHEETSVVCLVISRALTSDKQGLAIRGRFAPRIWVRWIGWLMWDGNWRHRHKYTHRVREFRPIQSSAPSWCQNVIFFAEAIMRPEGRSHRRDTHVQRSPSHHVTTSPCGHEMGISGLSIARIL